MEIKKEYICFFSHADMKFNEISDFLKVCLLAIDFFFFEFYVDRHIIVSIVLEKKTEITRFFLFD